MELPFSEVLKLIKENKIFSIRCVSDKNNSRWIYFDNDDEWEVEYFMTQKLENIKKELDDFGYDENGVEHVLEIIENELLKEDVI